MSTTAPATKASAKAVHTWSLFRTMGRFIAPGSMPSGDMAEGGGGGLTLLELPAALAAHGYTSAQVCHFYLASREQAYLDEVRDAFAASAVEIEAVLVDDGDLTHPTDADAQQEWLSGWVDTAARLGPTRVRIPAGKQPPTPDTLRTSAERLRVLADRHAGVRLVVENWHRLLADAAAVTEVLDRTEGRIGFLVDLGNWRGPGKYAELAAVAARAETCQAKVGTDAAGAIDAEDYRRCLQILVDAGYTGPLAMVHDGPDPDEWGLLDQAYDIVRSVVEAPGA